MKTLGTVLGNILGVSLALALTAAIGFYGYLAAKRFVMLFARLDFPVAMVTATATVALLLSAMVIAASIRRAGEQSREAHLRADKAEAYRLFIGLWEEVLRPGQTAEAVAQMSRQMQDVNHLLVLQGSTAVVKAHAAMQTLNVREARTQFAAALLAIRKDMGLESRGLEAKELGQLLLSESGNAHGAGRSNRLQDSQPRVSLAPN
jgi:predicted small integral membrane protein